MQDENDRLVKDIGNVKKELEQATEDMNNITDDYSKLKVFLYKYKLRNKFFSVFMVNTKNLGSLCCLSPYCLV